MITLSNMLKAFVGMIVAVSGLVFTTTPPAAASTDVIEPDTVVCRATASTGFTTLILMDQELFQVGEERCTKLSSEFKKTAPNGDDEEINYQFVSLCLNSRNIEVVDKACESGAPAITVHDWKSPSEFEQAPDSCLHTDEETEEIWVGRQCKIFIPDLS